MKNSKKDLPKSKPLGEAPDLRAIDIVKDYCSRHPDAPSKTLARLIYREYPAYFKSLDSCYYSVRRVFGVAGKSSRKYGDKENNRAPRPPGYIPKAEKDLLWIETYLDSGNSLILSDIHFPFHHEKSIRAAVDIGKKMDVDNIILNGDILDCHHLSRFSKRPDVGRYNKEIEVAQMFFDYLREQFPKARIIFKEGNHEERLETYLATKAKEFWGMSALDWSNLLKLNEFGIEMSPTKCPIYAGELAIFHGHELPRGISDPVNPARGLFLRCLEHTMAGHWHKSSQHSDTTASGHVISTFSTGCMCSLRPRWLPVNKWQNGFATIEHKKKEFSVDNYRVVGGKPYR